MSENQKYLYCILHPNYALVASMLPPEEFGRHYNLGSSRFFHGQVVFAEVDSSYRHEYFNIEEILKGLKAKADGRPKRTKFIKTYRVLEHIELSAIKNLYITSVLGKVLELKPESQYDISHEKGFLRTYQEICPLRSVVLSFMDPPEFGKFITAENATKGAPKVFFTQIDLNIDNFLTQIEEDPFLVSPIPNVHAHKLKSQILEMRARPEKRVKGISLDSAFSQISFLRLRTGFWFAHRDEFIYYPIPDHATLENDHYDWFRSLSS